MAPFGAAGSRRAAMTHTRNETSANSSIYHLPLTRAKADTTRGHIGICGRISPPQYAIPVSALRSRH
jgi:hypothetical protein